MFWDPISTDAVLLLDQEWVSTLYVGLALCRAGYDVHVLTAAGATSLGQWFTWGAAPSVHDPAYLEEVARHVDACRPRWVIPLTEKILSRVWDDVPSWEHAVFPRTVPWQRDLLADKHAMAQFVAASGVRVPGGRYVDTMDALDEAIVELGLPIVVKPPRGAGGDRVTICTTAAEAEARVRELTVLPGAGAILQQYIDGETYLVGGVFSHGVPLRLYSAQKLELYPERVGPAQRLRSTADPALRDIAQRVFELLEWTGLASADFVRDVDGHYYFLEMNPRPWGSIAAAADAGVDLFSAYAALLRGDAIAPDLRCRDGVVSTLFPQRMASRVQPGNGWSLLRAAFDPASWRAIPWRKPSLAWHLAKRVYWTYK